MKMLFFLSIAIFFVDISFPQQILYSQGSGDLSSITWNTERDGSGTNELPGNNNLVIQNHTITINMDITINSIIVEEGGTFIFEETTSRSVTILNDITIHPTGKFRSHLAGSSIIHNLIIGGNIINDGDFDMAVTGTRVCNVTFNKNDNQTISGSGSFIFNEITLDMGTSRDNVLEILSPINIKDDGLTLVNGTFKLNSASTITPFSGNTTIPLSAGIHLNHTSATSNWGTSGSLIVNGLLKIENGSMTVGSSSGNRLEINGANTLLHIVNGNLFVTGRIFSINNPNFNIEGGLLDVSTSGSIDLSNPTFRVPGGSSFNMSGGIIKINNANEGNGGDIEWTGASGNYSITGGKIVVGNGNSTNGMVKLNSVGVLNELEINCSNNNSAKLNSNISIAGSLVLTSGILDISDYNLTLSGTSAITGNAPSAANMIVTNGSGKLQKIFPAPSSFVFPIGDNFGTAEYSPAVINFLSGSFTNSIVGVSVKNEKHPNISNASTNYISRFWSVSTDIITLFSADVEFNYTDADVVGPEANIISARLDGSNWIELDAADHAGNKLTGTVSGFSDFSGAETSALPVELIDFAARNNGKIVVLSWATASEIDNYGFEIQRKKSSSLYWETISFVEGNGNSSSKKTYNYIDKNISAGKYFYRLKQIDNSGEIKYYPEIEVIVKVPNEFELFQNYPNPFNPSTTIEFNLPKDSKVKLEIFNVLGEKIIELINGFFEAGFHTAVYNAGNVKSGLYIYRLSANELVQTRKMIFLK